MSKVSTEIAYRFIRRKIVTGKYPPGAPLQNKRMTDDVGLSRTPIRDALRQLEADGLVEIKPRLGARVKDMTIEELADLNEIRLALEKYAAESAAADHDHAALGEIRAALAEMDQHYSKISKDLENFELLIEFQEADLRFHLAVLAAARNPLLRKECTRIHVLSQIFSGRFALESYSAHLGKGRLEQVAITLKEHGQIYRAIASKNAAAARMAMETHLLPKVKRYRNAAEALRCQQQMAENNASLYAAAR